MRCLHFMQIHRRYYFSIWHIYSNCIHTHFAELYWRQIWWRRKNKQFGCIMSNIRMVDNKIIVGVKLVKFPIIQRLFSYSKLYTEMMWNVVFGMNSCGRLLCWPLSGCLYYPTWRYEACSKQSWDLRWIWMLEVKTSYLCTLLL